MLSFILTLYKENVDKRSLLSARLFRCKNLGLAKGFNCKKEVCTGALSFCFEWLTSELQELPFLFLV